MNDVKDLIAVSEIDRSNLIDILTWPDEKIDDYVQDMRDRISEELRTRIETGMSIPVRDLTWCFRGVGWEILDDVRLFSP